MVGFAPDFPKQGLHLRDRMIRGALDQDRAAVRILHLSRDNQVRASLHQSQADPTIDPTPWLAKMQMKEKN